MITILIFIIILLLGFIFYLLKNKKQNHIPAKETDHIAKLNPEEDIQPISKRNAMNLINKYSKDAKLELNNTSFSTINKAVPLWWFNVSPEKFQSDLHLLLAAQDYLIWVFLPEGSVSDPKRKFRMRDDKGLIEIKISAMLGNNYLRDEASGGIGLGFEQFVQKEFKI